MKGNTVKAIGIGTILMGSALTLVNCGGSTVDSSVVSGLQRAAPGRNAHNCGAKPGSPALIAELEQELRSVDSSRAGGTVVIPVYVHVITDGATGNVSNATIARQIELMNRAFDGRNGGTRTRYSFRHAATDRTSNAAWYTADLDSPAELAMKTALHRGGASSFNLYINLGNPEQQSGWSSFPWEYRSKPILDGVVLWNGALPGSGVPGFDLGMTAVHELGHWLGLFHTFEGGCAAPGDGIGDTAAEQPGVDGCPAGRDTCSSPGLDPVDNYMDYATDACKTRFTPGQISKMNLFWARYRGQ